MQAYSFRYPLTVWYDTSIPLSYFSNSLGKHCKNNKLTVTSSSIRNGKICLFPFLHCFSIVDDVDDDDDDNGDNNDDDDDDNGNDSGCC